MDDPTLVCQAAEAIRSGDVVAFPTETVYGLGADALNPSAVARIFEIKERPRFDPLIVHICDQEQLYDLVEEVSPQARKLIDHFWPGPLTIILPKKSCVPDIVTSGLPGVGIRMPSHPLARALIKQSKTPLAAPSANKFGRVSPTKAQDVVEQLGSEVRIILDGGPSQVGVESTIISFMQSSPMMLRPGGTALESIEQTIGPVEIPAANDLVNASPGRLAKHYAPRKPLTLDFHPGLIEDKNRKGLLCLNPPRDTRVGYARVEILSPSGSLTEAACNLFAAIRRLDNEDIDEIVAVPVPNHGLGRAINDRLHRASAR